MRVGRLLLTAASMLWFVLPATSWAAPFQQANSTDLLANNSWGCLRSSQVNDRRVVITAGDTYNTVVNERVWLIAPGDFAISARLRTEASSFAGISLFGSLAAPRAEWWQGQKRLDLGLSSGKLTVWAYDGTSPNLAWSRSFATPALGLGPASVRVQKVGPQLVFFAGDAELGRAADSGIFSSGRIYPGANVAPHNQLTLDSLSAMPLNGSSLRVEIPGATVRDTNDVTGSRSLAEALGLAFGTAIGDPARLRNDAYRSLVAREYDLVTPANALKFGPVHPAPDRYAFCDADDIINFAEANGIGIRGHTLIWHNQLPDWLTGGGFSRDQLLSILHDHISTVVGRYRGRIRFWDVVNEVMGDDAKLRKTIWLQTIGPEYIALAFQWAHEADPDALLFFNEYGAEGSGAKSDAVYALLRDLKAHGVPIDGVGLQSHFRLADAPSAEALQDNMARLADLGLQVQVTEIDVRLRLPPTDDDLSQQAAVYRRALDACLDQPACGAFVGWNAYDGDSWIPGFFPGFGSARTIDEAYHPKPAYYALVATLQESPSRSQGPPIGPIGEPPPAELGATEDEPGGAIQ